MTQLLPPLPRKIPFCPTHVSASQWSVQCLAIPQRYRDRLREVWGGTGDGGCECIRVERRNYPTTVVSSRRALRPTSLMCGTPGQSWHLLVWVGLLSGERGIKLPISCKAMQYTYTIKTQSMFRGRQAGLSLGMSR